MIKLSYIQFVTQPYQIRTSAVYIAIIKESSYTIIRFSPGTTYATACMAQKDACKTGCLSQYNYSPEIASEIIIWNYPNRSGNFRTDPRVF